MKKSFSTTFIELLIVVCIIMAVVEISIPIINKFTMEDTGYYKLKGVQNVISKGLEEYDKKGIGFRSWDWNKNDTYEASEEILYNYIVPLFNKNSNCNNPLACVGGFLSKNLEEYINYKQKTDYARAIVGKNTHIALRTTRYCEFDDSNSLCAIFVIDVNNKDGYNRLGEDVFVFGFYGNGKFMPFGYNYSIENINKNCSKNSNGETCAAKLFYEYNNKIKS